MIKLTHLSGEEFVLNAELIRYIERRPDTFVALTTGERLVVRESLDEVMRRARLPAIEVSDPRASLRLANRPR